MVVLQIILRFLLFGLLLLVVLSNANAQSSKRDAYRQQFSKVYPAEQVIADVDFFAKALEAAHPDLYRYITKQQMQLLLAQIKGQAGHINNRELYNQLNHIASAIGCGHLVLSYPKKQEKYFSKYAYALPLHIELHDSVAVAIKSYIDSAKVANAIVRSINGEPVDSILLRMNQFLTRDGYITSANSWLLETGWFNDFYLRFWPDSSTYTYGLEMLTDSGWVIKNITLPGYDYQKMKIQRYKREKPTPKLHLKFDDYTQTAILTLESFDPKEIAQGKQNFNKFIKQAFWQIVQEQPEQLIIDLRGNEGGNSFYPEAIIGFLSNEPFRLYRNMQIRYNSLASGKPIISITGIRQYKKMQKHSLPAKNGNRELKQFTERYVTNYPYGYQGTVYVMVNGGTYSAASELACYLKQHVEAIVVGSETGGTCDPVTAGMYGLATLPNTGIAINIPLISFEKDIKQPRISGHGLMPDIPQHLRSTDSIPDPELEHLLEVIEAQGAE
jgi:hypothetical protein